MNESAEVEAKKMESDIRMYIDGRGCKYKVMSGIGLDTFKARYQKPDKHGNTGWKCVKSLPWRSTREEAQADLDHMAASAAGRFGIPNFQTPALQILSCIGSTFCV